MKKVLVTGADGFIGSHLVEFLVEKGFEVRALSLYNSFNNWGWLEDVSVLKQIEVLCGDIRDPYFCRELVKGVDVVYNLAALIAIPFSYKAPQSYVNTNCNGTLNMLQAALDAGVSKFVQTSTSEVYGTADYVPIDEKHPLKPQSPYSATKIGSDSLAMSFFYSFEMPVTIARPFNTFGPRQSLRAVIPTIIGQLANGVKEIKLGDLSPTRDFNFVKDACNGFYLLGESDNVVGETYNFGRGNEISIGDLVKLIIEIMGVDATVTMDEQRIRPEKSEVQRLWCDNSKIKKALGYGPKFTLEEGLKETIDWFREEKNLSKYKTDIYNV